MANENMKSKWWGYRHTSGSVQAKPYRSWQDVEEAYASPFCAQVVEPFECDDRDDALKIVEARTSRVATLSGGDK